MITNSVFVVDENGTPLQPTNPGKARILQREGKAKKIRLYPFTIMLQHEINVSVTSDLELRIDPGSKFTGLSIVNLKTNTTIWAMELEHRGQRLCEDLQKRAGFRRGRRSRNLRYRKKRFNRHKPDGWLAPSLRHRVLTVETWIRRIKKYAPIVSIAIESVKFDLQKMENPDISGVEYQQGTLQGYTIREALLEHWGRDCVYCGEKNQPLEIEHIKPKSKGGSNRFSNLTLSCTKCNQDKGNKSIEEYLAGNPTLLQEIKSKQKTPLKDAAAVNSTRIAILSSASKFGVPVITGDGASTKMIRIKSGLPKEHWIDSACVATDKTVKLNVYQPLRVKSTGHGSRQSRRVNSKGFPVVSVKLGLDNLKVVTYIKPKEEYKHCRAGDYVKATLATSRKSKKFDDLGEYIVNVKAGTYQCRIKTPNKTGAEVVINGKRVSVKQNYIKFIHRSDGYSYNFTQINRALLQDQAI
ncbi:MAG: HNH endonuclease [Stigonema ocellatum SAG 48.90 = DSM 106950]|nr:HNH endonuclease [Stigonema ocellatum SAG 48.90 = DSM 106950]